MGEPVSVGRVLRGTRTFAAGAISALAARELLAELRRRADEADELVRLAERAAAILAAAGVAPGAYRAVCLHCRRPLVAVLDDLHAPGTISWVASLPDGGWNETCWAADDGRHDPIAGWRLAELDA